MDTSDVVAFTLMGVLFIFAPLVGGTLLLLERRRIDGGFRTEPWPAAIERYRKPVIVGLLVFTVLDCIALIVWLAFVAI